MTLRERFPRQHGLSSPTLGPRAPLQHACDARQKPALTPHERARSMRPIVDAPANDPSRRSTPCLALTESLPRRAARRPRVARRVWRRRDCAW